MAIFRVSKCCCCFSLKYGFLTFAILSLLYRICGAISLAYFASPTVPITISSSRTSPDSFYVSDEAIISKISFHATIGGSFVGWYAVTAGILIVAINGIFQKRAILIYPYIVVLSVEIIVMFVAAIIIAVISTPWILLHAFFCGIINGYTIVCLISLYRNFKDYERSRPPTASQGMTVKTV